ncbi:MAG: ribonuclease III [Firmicutes bacterium]|nr:ribonuclease III [Bacillota bacterium]
MENPPEINAAELSPALWAYLGDALHELAVREYLLAGKKYSTTGALHREAIRLVRAENQARLLQLLAEEFTPEEKEILRRGRNQKSGHIPAHTDPVTYRHSTAWEGLLGYLYLTGKKERVKSLLAKALKALEKNLP